MKRSESSRKMSRNSVYWIYKDNRSVNRNAYNDMKIGYDNCIVGTNATSGPQIHIGSLILNMDSNHNWICIYENCGSASNEEAKIWSQSPGGLIWNFNYKVKPLTPLVRYTKEMQQIIRKNHPENTSHFFNQVRHGKKGSSHDRTINLLKDFINQNL